MMSWAQTLQLFLGGLMGIGCTMLSFATIAVRSRKVSAEDLAWVQWQAQRIGHSTRWAKHNAKLLLRIRALGEEHGALTVAVIAAWMTDGWKLYEALGWAGEDEAPRRPGAPPRVEPTDPDATQVLDAARLYVAPMGTPAPSLMEVERDAERARAERLADLSGVRPPLSWVALGVARSEHPDKWYTPSDATVAMPAERGAEAEPLSSKDFGSDSAPPVKSRQNTLWEQASEVNVVTGPHSVLHEMLGDATPEPLQDKAFSATQEEQAHTYRHRNDNLLAE
jgi:hypothetical protein